MEFSTKLLSQTFLSDDELDTFSFQVSRALWERVIRSESEGRVFLRISNEAKEWIAPLGQPISDYTDEEYIYIPQWMLLASGFTGSGEEIHCEVMNTEAFPEATKLTLRVVDSAFYNSDVKEQLELSLSSIGVVRKHTTLQIPVTALGGYPVEIFVSATEPAELVLCQGEEVAVEFEEPVDHFEPPEVQTRRPDTPPPCPLVYESLVPMEAHQPILFPGAGQRLGTLDSSYQGPEWRRGLQPPPRR